MEESPTGYSMTCISIVSMTKSDIKFVLKADGLSMGGLVIV